MAVSDDDLATRLALLFREELQDNLRILADGLVRLQDRERLEPDRGLLTELFRAAHSLKGAAHSAAIDAAISPCHRLESLFAALRDGTGVVDDDALTSFADALDELGAVDRAMGRDVEPTTPARGPMAEPNVSASATPGPLLENRARIGVADLDELVDRAGALVSATAKLHRLSAVLAHRRDEPGGPALDAVADQSAAIDRELGQAARSVTAMAQRLRMQRIDDITSGLEHTVRELARSMGKQATLSVHGGELKVDRDVGDALRDPLLHLLRNAIDHGLEAPEERMAAGKSSAGQVRIAASLEGGRVRIAVVDDGRGVDTDALRALAPNDGHAEEGEPDLDLAFRPGLSTAATVTEVSGRGVGLDAVRARVESLGGSVQIHSGPTASGPGPGTEVVMHVPLTLAVVHVVLVAVDQELIALPAAAVARVRRVEPEALQVTDGRLLVVERDDARPGVSLGAALGLPSFRDPDPHVVVEIHDERAVLLVDGVDAYTEGILHRLPARATASAAVLGALVLPGDRASLVVNPAVCVRAVAHLPAPARPTPIDRSRAVILLAEDTLTTRALERSVLVGAGYEVIDVADGAEAWEVVNREVIDLVVSDVDMPRMDGIELCQAIRSSPPIAALPVVLVTSMESDEDRRRGVEAGANSYLVKSAFDQRSLLDAVRRLL